MMTATTTTLTKAYQVTIFLLSTLFGLTLSLLLVLPTLLLWSYYWLKSQWYAYKWGKQGYTPCFGYDAILAHFPKIIINFAIFLPEVPSIEKFRQVMNDRLGYDEQGNIIFPKFLRTIEKLDGYIFWKSVPEEMREPAKHMFIYPGTPPASESELKDLISEIHGQPLRPEAPLWQVILIPLQGDYIHLGTRCCMLVRIHHCLADGISMLRIFAQHLNDNPSKFIALTALARARLTDTATTKILKICYTLPSFFKIFFSQLLPERNILHGSKLKGEAFCTWKKFDLQTIKDIKNATQTTVNDVLMSCLAGTLRRYFIFKQAEVPKTLGAFMPLALHLPESAADMNNAFSYVILKMCSGIEDPIERLKMSKKVLDKMKKSPDALANYWILHTLMARLPENWIKYFGNLVNNSTVFSSNICGPQEPLHFMGQEVSNCFPLLHHHQGIGIGFGLFGYNGTLNVSCSADKAVVDSSSDTELMLHYFELEVKELSKRINQMNNNSSK